MKNIYEYLLGKHSKATTQEISWDELKTLVCGGVILERETKLINLFKEYFPESFGQYLIEFLMELHEDDFEFQIGEGGSVVINHKTKLVKLETANEGFDTVILYVSIYNVHKHNALMIAYDNYFYTVNVYFEHQKDDESMIEFCDQDQWEETNRVLSVKFKNATESTYKNFEKLLNEVK